MALNNYNTDIDELFIGDFIGDSKDDVFWGNGADFLISEDGSEQWDDVFPASLSVDDLGFGNFVGNDKTDILWFIGTDWIILDVNNMMPTLINMTGPTSVDNLLYGNFVGSPTSKDDILWTTGTQWRVYDIETDTWTLYYTSSLLASDLKCADIDGNGYTDILTVFDSYAY